VVGHTHKYTHTHEEKDTHTAETHAIDTSRQSRPRVPTPTQTPNV